MDKSQKHLKIKIILSLFFSLIASHSVLGFSYQNITQKKDTTALKSSIRVEQLYKSDKLKEVLEFCKQELPKFLNNKVKDSLEITWLNYYQFETQFRFQDYLESVKSTELGIAYSPSSQEGVELKAILYYKKAYAEDKLNFPKRSFKSMQTAASLLYDLDEPNGDYTVGAHIYLSQRAANNGDLEEAKYYIRQAERAYFKNKEAIDVLRTDVNGNTDRYEAMLPYKKLYIFSSTADSLTIVGFMQELENLHKLPNFNITTESIYYTAGLNILGNWYATRKPKAETTKADLEQAINYLDKALYFYAQKGYAGNELQYKYNKCKALALSNRLEEADALMTELLQKISKQDGRRPFFLAQKGLISAKMKQKDSALSLFYNAIKSTHTGDSVLAKDYNNFKPNQVYNRTGLFLRIAEELNTYFSDDEEVKQSIAQLYYMAFIQFENSYNRSKFNKKDNDYLKQIIHGILQMKRQGYGLKNITNEDLLNRSEIIKNQILWKRFNQNRYANSLPELDSLQQRKLTLRSAMAYAKLSANIGAQDSVATLLKKVETYAKSMYPNLNLFTEKLFNLKELQSQLKANDVVLKYEVLKDEIAIFRIYKTRFDVVLKPFKTPEKELIDSFIDDVIQQKFNSEVSEKLAEILIPKLDENSNNIIIKPDENLLRLPFEILKYNKQFLIENYSISYTSSLGFIHPEIAYNKRTDILAIYVPEYGGETGASATRSYASALIGAKNEAEAISALFPSIIYSQSGSGKNEFLETAKDASLLHLAMHAEVNNKEPGLSRLLFSNASNSQDLYLEELYGLSLNADLAVLSACNTGLGKENAGRGMESFQRAFTFAGVPATVASLWEVPDTSTKQIMEGFYAYLSKGFTKSKSLQNAKQDYIKTHANSKLAQPYYWAGFVIYGEDRALSQKSSNLYLYGLITSLVLISGIGLFIRQRRIHTA